MKRQIVCHLRGGGAMGFEVPEEEWPAVSGRLTGALQMNNHELFAITNQNEQVLVAARSSDLVAFHVGPENGAAGAAQGQRLLEAQIEFFQAQTEFVRWQLREMKSGDEWKGN